MHVHTDRERGPNWCADDEDILIDEIIRNWDSNSRRFSDEWWSIIEESFNSRQSVSDNVVIFFSFKINQIIFTQFQLQMEQTVLLIFHKKSYFDR